ncbi:MAG: XdhC family protein [Actinomycetota bacterium]
MGTVLDRSEDLRASRTPFVSATVVRAERPTSAKAGDAAIVLSDGTIEGFVGGDCAESSVRAHALASLDAREPVLLRILPEAAVDAPEQPGALTVHNPCLSGGSLEIFLEPWIPPALLVVQGASPVALALRELGAAAGFSTAAASEGVQADATAVIAASHGRDDEAAVLVEAVRSGVPYVGLVASPRRGAGVIGALDLDDEQRAAIHSPAGLDIGARTPEEIALSILAEIVSIRPRVVAAAPVVAAEPAGENGTALDPVCGMTVATVPSSSHLDLDRARTWFCGPGCRDAFAADPASYGAG